MRAAISAFVALTVLALFGSRTRAADDAGTGGAASGSAPAAIDKAVQAAGGREKLAAVKAVTWANKGTITVGGNDAPFTSRATFQGPERRRAEFEADFGGQTIKGIVVVNGNKGWRQFNGMTEELSADELARERRTGYMEWSTVTLLPLKQEPFKIEPAGEQKVNDKPATGVKATGPDGKTHTIYFDPQTGLPARIVAQVTDFAGDAKHETTISDYKDFGGLKKATKIKVTRDGEKFIDSELTEFTVLDSVDPKTFEKPE
jgi:hypothetical protein